jgi:hypothetical protein
MRHARLVYSLCIALSLIGSAPAWAQHRGGFRGGFGHIRIYGGLGYWGMPFGYWGGPFGRYPYPGYVGYRGAAGRVELAVKPDQARVVVDGYYAGSVDDLGGSIALPPGGHEIALKLDGFKTHRVAIYASLGNTLKIKHEMVRGTGEDAPDALAVGPGTGPADEAQLPGVGTQEGPASGEVRLNVKPADASVYVDGEFLGAGRDVKSLTLPPGRHHIEVVRPGFRGVTREVKVDRGGGLDLEVVLDRR